MLSGLLILTSGMPCFPHKFTPTVKQLPLAKESPPFPLEICGASFLVLLSFSVSSLSLETLPSYRTQQAPEKRHRCICFASNNITYHSLQKAALTHLEIACFHLLAASSRQHCCYSPHFHHYFPSCVSQGSVSSLSPLYFQEANLISILSMKSLEIARSQQQLGAQRNTRNQPRIYEHIITDISM